MSTPLIISYNNLNLKNLGKNSDKVLKDLSGIHTCRFYFHPNFQRHKRLRISIDGQIWTIIAGFGKDGINLINPWFIKEEDLNGVNESDAIVEECAIVFANSRINPIDVFIAKNYTASLSQSKAFLTKCAKIEKPITPVHKEDEKEIWTAYCDGLNALNKEKRDFITVKNVLSPISYQDTRLGNIFTIRLDIDRKSIESIPDYVNNELNSKFQVHSNEFDEEKKNFSINFMHVEKFNQEDMESINQHMRDYGFIPSKQHLKNVLKASISLSKLNERQDVLSEFEDALSRNEIIFTNDSSLLYYFENPSDKEKIEEISKDFVKYGIRIDEVSTFSFDHFLEGNEYKLVAEDLKDTKGIIVSKSKITICYSDSFSYENKRVSVEEVLRNYNINVIVPSYRLTYKLSEEYTLENRSVLLSEALNKLIETKSLSTKIEFDLETARVIRFDFLFRTSEDREYIVHTLENEFNDLGSVYKLTLKKRLGFTQLNYTIDSKVLNEIEENYKLNYQGEEIKLVNGRVYNSLFKDVDDPNNIVDQNKRNQYNRFMEECPVIGVCHKMTSDYVVVRLDEDFYNGERMTQAILSGDMIFFPSVGSSTDLRRQSEAILRINKPGLKLSNGRVVSPPANAKLCDFLFSPIYARGIKGDIKSMMTKISGNKLESSLNEKQIEAVAKAVLADDIAFIQGPPGTGKTTVIAEIIWQEIHKNPQSRILLTSQTNLAVDNALERLKYKKSIRPLRVISEQRIDNDDILYNINVLDNWVENPNEYTKGNVVENWIDTIAERMNPDNNFTQELAEWKSILLEKNKKTRRFFVDKYKENVNLIAATCSLCGSLLFKQMYSKMYNIEDISFDVVIMDEASKATPLEMAIPMVLGKKIIVIGDHKQLPPLMDENSIDTALKKIGRHDLALRIEDLKESQFKKLFLMAQKFNPTLVTTLDTQYRMHNDIMQTINQFYEDELGENGLKCGIEKDMNNSDMSLRGSRFHGISCEPFISNDTHAIWVDVEGVEDRENTSYKNMAEINAIKTIMNLLTRSKGFSEYIHSRKKIEDKEIGLITFYSAQKREIRKLVENNELDCNLDYRIDVVDRFQGMERNIVIVSTVRSNRYNGIGFAKDIERINVAFSRARTLLIVVGNRDLFSIHSNYKKSIGAMEYINIKQLEDILKNEY